MQITEITVSIKKTWGRGKDQFRSKSWDGGEIILSSTASLNPTENPAECRRKLFTDQRNQISDSMKQNNILEK